MGNSNLLRNQIVYYYLFHKKLECFFNSGYNPFYNNKSNELKIEKFYVINKNLIRNFKEYWQYYLFKYNFDQINMNDFKGDIDKYKSQLEKKFDEINKEVDLKQIPHTYIYNEFVENQLCSKNMLSLENFENVLDEKSYDYFQKNIKTNQESKIKGTITHDKIILFYKNNYVIKFLYYGELFKSNGQNNRELIQLTADFSKFYQGSFDEEETKQVYNYFKKYCCEDINKAFQLFEDKSIRIIGEVKIRFPAFIEFFGNVTLSFKLKNENLCSQTIEQSFRKFNNKELNPNFGRKIGLDNVGATCYMNATLQCFINVPSLTKYLLKNKNFQKITQESYLFELTSAYCNLLYHIFCDEYVTKSYEPQEFKNVISGKNPLFQGVNANDSKDLVIKSRK